MKNIWIFLERLKPTPQWGLRIGNKWVQVDEIICETVTETRTQRKQPYAYLFTVGNVEIRNKIAIIHE